MRWLFVPLGSDPYLVVAEGVFPAIVLAALLALAAWCAPDGRLGAADGAAGARVLLVGGALGFLLHNQVSFSLWAPGAGMAFWIVLGTAGARGRAGQALVRGRREALRNWLPATVLIVGGLAATVAVAAPVLGRLGWTDRLLGALHRGNPQAARDFAVRAMHADPLDAVSAADAAELEMEAVPARALALADRAIQRDPQHFRYHYLAWQAAHRTYLGGRPPAEPLEAPRYPTYWPLATRHLREAAALNPHELRLRIDYAGALAAAGQYERALEQIAAARRINAALNPESVERLRRREREELDRLERGVRARLGAQRAASTRPSPTPAHASSNPATTLPRE